MNSACQSFREGLHDPLDAEAPFGHPEGCPQCAEYASRVARATRGLTELEQLEAPDALEGMVVAALQAGVREGRAVRAVSDLERQALPEQLERAVETEVEIAAVGGPFETERVQVPSVLDRLVHEELSDPIKANVRRVVSSLPRERAPAELDVRVHADLLEQDTPAPARPRFGRRLMLVGTSIAAGVLALLFLRPGPEPRSPSFRVEAASLEDMEYLDPFAREVVSSLGGGLLSVKEL